MTLIERLKAATGPDRELDGDIAVSLGQVNAEATNWTRREDGWLWYRFVEPDAFDTWEAPHYTATIDAALALVERMLSGALWRVEKCSVTLVDQMNAPYWATAGKAGEQEAAYGNTAPLAILIALFTALQGKETTHDDK